jgi:hypothetical protein
MRLKFLFSDPSIQPSVRYTNRHARMAENRSEKNYQSKKNYQVELLRILGSVLGHGLPGDQDFATGRDEVRHKALRAGCEEIVEA